MKKIVKNLNLMINIRKLKNGVTLIVEEFKEIETVSVRFLVKSGARNETSKSTGLSHFIEHMAFKGTETRNAKQLSNDLENIGARFNAYTSKETTCYHAKVLKEYTEKSMEILIDMLENSIFNEEELERERGVILQELAMNNDTPDDYVYDRFMETVFAKQQIGQSILGPAKNIKSFQREDFFNYLDKNYIAQNIILSVCGNIDTDKVEAMANKLFKKTKSGKVSAVKKAQYVGGHYRKNKKLEQFQCLIGFKGTSYSDEEKYIMKAGNYIFGGGMSSRLFQEIREKQGLCYSIGSYNNAFYDSGIFTIYIGTDGEKVNKAIDGIIEQYKLFIDKGVNKDELERVKITLRTSIMIESENSSSRAGSNAYDYARHGRIIPNEEVTEKINAVKNDDIKDLFRKMFTIEPITVALYGNSANVYEYEAIKNKIK
jgi:predicted Zn-dependent peptidase